jgi:hypothetical protein
MTVLELEGFSFNWVNEPDSFFPFAIDKIPFFTVLRLFILVRMVALVLIMLLYQDSWLALDGWVEY